MEEKITHPSQENYSWPRIGNKNNFYQDIYRYI